MQFKTVIKAGLIAATAMTAGCTSLLVSEPDPLDTYTLSAPSVDVGGGNRRIQILVAEPVALKDLDGQNIVIRTSGTEVQYLAGAQWSDRLPKVVQAKLVEGLENSGRFGGIGRPGEGLAIDYQLLTEVREFSVAGESARVARVEIAAKLLNDRNGVVRSTETFTAERAVSGTGNAAYARALDSAFTEAAGSIVAWLARQI